MKADPPTTDVRKVRQGVDHEAEVAVDPEASVYQSARTVLVEASRKVAKKVQIGVRFLIREKDGGVRSEVKTTINVHDIGDTKMTLVERSRNPTEVSTPIRRTRQGKGADRHFLVAEADLVVAVEKKLNDSVRNMTTDEI